MLAYRSQRFAGGDCGQGATWARLLPYQCFLTAVRGRDGHFSAWREGAASIWLSTASAWSLGASPHCGRLNKGSVETNFDSRSIPADLSIPKRFLTAKVEQLWREALLKRPYSIATGRLKGIG